MTYFIEREKELKDYVFGETRTITFKLREGSPEIVDVVTGCGCTLADIDEDGVKVSFKITRSSRYSPYFNKTVVVRFEDGKREKLKFYGEGKFSSDT